MTLTPFERIRLDKAAIDEGFGIRRADEGEWLAYESLGPPAAIRLTAVPEGYVAAVDHDGVAADLATRWTPWAGKAPVGFQPFAVNDTAPLHELVREMWRLARGRCRWLRCANSRRGPAACPGPPRPSAWSCSGSGRTCTGRR